MAKDLRQGKRVAYLQALGALGGWSFGILGLLCLGAIFHEIARFNWVEMAVIPLLLCCFSFVNVRFQMLRKFGLKGRYQTLIVFNLHWLWAIYVSTMFPADFNAFCCLELFLIGLIVLVTTSSLFTLLIVGFGNIAQISIVYASFHVPFGLDEKISLFFAILMTITCSIVAYLNQKNVHRLRESEARRVKAETDRLHEAKEAELARQALINAEALHRVQAAADVAHHVNNPLNYIQLSLLHMRDKLQELEGSLMHLLGEDESHEHQLVRTYYSELFTGLKDPLQDADVGVRQVAEAIAEVRSLSGLDGYEIESFTVTSLIQGCLDKLLPLVSREAIDRLQLKQPVPEHWQVRGNRYLSKSILVSWMQCVLGHSRGLLILSIQLEPVHSRLTLELRGEFSNIESGRLQLEARLESLIQQSPIQLEILFQEDCIRICHHLLDRPIVQEAA